MNPNWWVIGTLLCISLPGTLIAIPRLVAFLIPSHSERTKQRASLIIIAQTLLTTLVMIASGVFLSEKTGLQDPLITTLLNGQGDFLNFFLAMLIPITLYTLLGFVIYCALYYGVAQSVLDEKTIEVFALLRQALKWDGCVLYGGVVEEIIARWGLMNLLGFIALLFIPQMDHTFMSCTALIFSGVLFAMLQAPIYLAAGCASNKRFLYVLMLLSLCQTVLFGCIFWHYGLVASMLSHMLFHLFWYYYDPV
jgi:hypothetical protein